MKMHPLYPMTFRPMYKETLWGGDGIASRYNRGNVPARCGESQELSGRVEAPSIVTNGFFEGVSLTQLVQTFGRDLVGTKASTYETFPLMVKLLDVQKRIAARPLPTSESGATELTHRMWYFLKAAEGASVGELAVQDAAFTTAQGDIFDVSAGGAYLLGGGNLIYEVSKPSALTYEMAMPDDKDTPFTRTGNDSVGGQALGLRHCPPATASGRELLIRLTTPDFTFATLNLRRSRSLQSTAQSFMVLFCTAGKTTLDHDGPHPLTLLPGDLVLIPPKQQVMLHPLTPTHLLVTTL